MLYLLEFRVCIYASVATLESEQDSVMRNTEEEAGFMNSSLVGGLSICWCLTFRAIPVNMITLLELLGSVRGLTLSLSLSSHIYIYIIYTRRKETTNF